MKLSTVLSGTIEDAEEFVILLRLAKAKYYHDWADDISRKIKDMHEGEIEAFEIRMYISLK